MWETTIPGQGVLRLEQLVLDLNGTIARDGELLPGVAERLQELAPRLAIHLVTADTRGRAAELTDQLGITLARVLPGQESKQKRELIERLGAEQAVAVGNGRNDVAMLQEAALGIAVLGPEGLSADALQSADILVADVCDALDLLLHPQRLVATWRR